MTSFKKIINCKREFHQPLVSFDYNLFSNFVNFEVVYSENISLHQCLVCRYSFLNCIFLNIYNDCVIHFCSFFSVIRFPELAKFCKFKSGFTILFWYGKCLTVKCFFLTFHVTLKHFLDPI